MRIRRTIRFGVVGLLALTGIWGALSILSARAERDRARSADQLVSSLKVAAELRQSSDELTRMARLYVSTGEPKYRDYYQRILAIRNGSKPRPPGYDGIYWDEVLSGKRTVTDEGEPASLRERMRQAGFTEAELALLKQAEDQSNALTNLERTAMNAVTGRFQDDFGKFTRAGQPDLDLARAVMFGSDYHAAKGEILGPIDHFNRSIVQRLRGEMDRLHLRSLNLANLQVLIALLTGASMLVGLIYLRLTVLTPLRSLTRDAQALRNRDYSTRVKIQRKDEMGELGRTFNEMAEAISEDIAIRDKTAEELRLARDTAEKAVRTKSEFLANMSHEIRTPMNGIMGMTELLLGTALKKDQRDYLNLINQSAESLLTVINDILDFSKIEAGKLNLDFHEFNLRDSLGDTLQTLGFHAAEKGLELAYQVQSNVPDCLIGDLGRVRQVIVNLVSNAIKFTDKGEVVVDVLLDSLTRDQVSLHVLVKDTGIGVSPEKQKSIFESFTQAEGSTTRNYGGTGLGLTISQRLVELMKGRIWVESQPGVGSTFHFTLLLELGNEERESQRATLETLNALPVLVVDDNETNRKILEQTLQNWEMKPQTAANGTEALARLTAARESPVPVQLVLLDMMMPEMSGLEVARRITEEFGEAAPGILMLTSAGQSVSQDEASKLGIERTLTKPVKQSDLLDAISRMFGTSTRDEKSTLAESHKPPRVERPMKVLLAEDGRVNQMVAIKLLEKRGHSVVLAEDGQIAVDLHAGEPFDAILMDIQMPRMDGYAATKAIRTREETSGKHIAIIAMTANAMKGDRELCIDAGMDDYIAKPVRSDELYSILEKYATTAGVELVSTTNRDLKDSPSDVTPETDIDVFDRKRFRTQMSDRDLMIELIDLFPEETESLIGKARHAISTQDSAGLHAAAHSLKGTLGTYCATKAHLAAKSLDDFARAGNLSHAAESLAGCEREVERLRTALFQFRSTL